MNPTKFMFASLTMLVVGLAAFSTTIPTNINVQAQEEGEFCFNEVNSDGVVIGFTCFETRKECNDFRQDVKHPNEEETGIAKVTNCKEV